VGVKVKGGLPFGGVKMGGRESFCGNEENNISLHTFRAALLGLTQYFLGSLWHFVVAAAVAAADVFVVLALALDVLKHAYENVGF